MHASTTTLEALSPFHGIHSINLFDWRGGFIKFWAPRHLISVAPLRQTTTEANSANLLVGWWLWIRWRKNSTSVSLTLSLSGFYFSFGLRLCASLRIAVHNLTVRHGLAVQAILTYLMLVPIAWPPMFTRYVTLEGCQAECNCSNDTSRYHKLRGEGRSLLYR